ncbi:MAG TPA: NAD(P)-dependent oxidoreductase [Candidatus Paceibacterota bacterium]
MKIAILNHCYFTPDHIESLKKIGEVVEHPNTTTAQDAVDRIGDAEIAIADCFEIPLNKEFFSGVKNLKYLCLNTTGYNLVDIDSAKQHGITVSNLPGFSTEAVAEHAIALMFAVSKNIIAGDQAMRGRPFQLNPANRAHDKYIGTNLNGKTLGVIGLGKIGSRIAELGKGLGMKVIAYNRTPKDLPGVKSASIEEICAKSDVIAPAVAYSTQLKGLISEKLIKTMKPSAIIVNIARGELIDEAAMTNALQNKKLAGLGADVITDWSPNNPLLGLENVVLTPHMAFLTDESLKNMADIIVSNIRSFASGKAINVVNP